MYHPKRGLIRKIYLPKLVFPMARVSINLMTFMLSLAAMYLLSCRWVPRSRLSIIWLPVVIAIFTVFVLGLGLIVATANTFYRDCGHLVSVFLQAWYFATPIIFPMQTFEEPEWRLSFQSCTITLSSYFMRSCTRGDALVLECWRGPR